MLLAQIRTFFERCLMPDPRAGAGEEGHRLRRAVAALLREMTRMGEAVKAEEGAAVESAIRGHFGLTGEEASELIALAEAEREEATDYYQFTSLINAHYDPEQRVQVVEQLWRIAYADESLHAQEEYRVRKLAQLLHVSHRAFIATKHRRAEGP